MSVARTSGTDVTVVWNGSRYHPGGRQLITEEWTAPAPPEPTREPRSLTPDEVSAILTAHALGASNARIADRLGLSLAVVRFVVDANAAGVLVRGRS